MAGIKKLAAKHGYAVREITKLEGTKVFLIDPRFRHIAAISSGINDVLHAVALDESGIVFDPANEHDRRPWGTYDLEGFLEFSPVS